MSARAPTPSRWVVNARWDAMVVLSTIWVPLALLLLWRGVERAGVAGNEVSLTAFIIVLSLPHFLTTFTFTYLDVDQRNHYKKRPLLYFVIPALLAIGSWIHCATVGPLLLVSFWLWFGEHHVAAQNLGFASLYRIRNGEGEVDKRIDHLVFNMAWITTVFLYASRPLGEEGLFYLGRPVYTVPIPFRDEILAGLTTVAIGAFVLFLARQAQRRWRGDRVSLPKLFFMITTWPSFFAVPYLVPDADAAVILRSGYHSVQYLGLVYLLNDRRCRARGPADASGFLGRLVESGWFGYFALHAIIAVLVWYATEYIVNQPGAANDYSFRYLFFPGFALVHFFLDGLTWRFSTAHARKTVLPFLGPAPPTSAGTDRAPA